MRLKEQIEELKLIASDSEMDTMLVEIIEDLAEDTTTELKEELNSSAEKIKLIEERLSKFPDIEPLVAELRKQNTRTLELISKMGVTLDTKEIVDAIKDSKSDKEEKVLEKISKAIEKLSERKSTDYSKQLEQIALALSKGTSWEFNVTERDNRGGLSKVIAKII